MLEVTASEVAAELESSGQMIVVLDDDPTGTQTVSGVPVLTTFEREDLRWGLRQDAPACYVLTNTRSLDPARAGERNREVMAALVEASRAEGVRYVVISRSDSTLRGHYPLETDVLTSELARLERLVVDGTVIVPAYIDGGRVTLGSVHYLTTDEGLLAVGESEFAKDATFGFRSSDLRDYVEEKTRGRWRASEVATITLWDLREKGVEEVAAMLASLRNGRPVVVDAICDADLRVLALAALKAERSGATLLYRTGPSFVRARAGLEARPALTSAEVSTIRLRGVASPRSRLVSEHGLVVIGSHVAQTTRQLEALRSQDGITFLDLDVARLLDSRKRYGALREAASIAVTELGRADVVLATSRQVVTGKDADESLSIARSVSACLVEIVKEVTQRVSPAFVIAKGGITSSDVATAGLSIRRALVRGTLLPGIVSLWEPVDGTLAGIPFVVFAGNVGDDGALVSVLATLRGRT